jgi:hypothetical protein
MINAWNTMERRKFLVLLGTPAYAGLVRCMSFHYTPDNSKADVTIRISPVEIEVAPRRIIKTTGYNGSAPRSCACARANPLPWTYSMTPKFRS